MTYNATRTTVLPIAFSDKNIIDTSQPTIEMSNPTATTAPSSHEPLDDDKIEPVSRKSSNNSSNSHDDVESSSGHGDARDEEKEAAERQEALLERCSTKHSAIGDLPIQPIDSVIEIPDEFYDKLPSHRKGKRKKNRLPLLLLPSPLSKLFPLNHANRPLNQPQLRKEKQNRNQS